MKLNDLLDMTFREVISNYCVLFSEECCYFYGISTYEAMNEIANEYELCDEPSLVVEPILFNMEVLFEFEEADDDTEVMSVEKIRELIDNNLMIEKKKTEGQYGRQDKNN